MGLDLKRRRHARRAEAAMKLLLQVLGLVLAYIALFAACIWLGRMAGGGWRMP